MLYTLATFVTTHTHISSECKESNGCMQQHISGDKQSVNPAMMVMNKWCSSIADRNANTTKRVLRRTHVYICMCVYCNLVGCHKFKLCKVRTQGELRAILWLQAGRSVCVCGCTPPGAVATNINTTSFAFINILHDILHKMQLKRC